MKRLLLVATLASLLACNNAKKDENKKETKNPSPSTTPITDKVISTSPSESGASFVIDGKPITTRGSLLVTKDKKDLQPGSEYLCMLTASGGPNNEGLTLNFLLALKPGVYPVVGMAFHRGPGGQGEVYGGLLGGAPKLTEYRVNVTECTDLGSNNRGGHRWSISGHFDKLVIPAMAVMLLDKTKNHPREVTIEEGSFKNLTFDDNWEELMKKATEQFKKGKS